ncbi:MAG: hypothetical protein K8J09_02650 [Planctomycetes bacterium]|nr:hypothetical protein [Planctomycetota bacterium]MCC7395825.1 hypothetical protein [Planctomycetota bacterium]
MHHLSKLAALGLLTTAAMAQCFDPNWGTPIGGTALIGDVVLPVQPIGFTFPLGSASYADMSICSKGYIWLSNAGIPIGAVADFSATSAEFVAQAPRIAPLWSDLQLFQTSGGEVWVNSTPSVCTITWQNLQCYQGTCAQFTMQAQLFPSGEIQFNYGPGATNNSTQAAWAVGLVGVTPGLGVPEPPSSDISVSGFTPDNTLFELFPLGNTFDMPGSSIRLVPAFPGWVYLTPSNCASATPYGEGCVQQSDSIYESFAMAANDLAGTTVTWLRTSSGYTASTTNPGTFVAPSAAATNVAPGLLDGEQVFTLSAPMPAAGGPVSAINVTTKGLIQLASTPGGTVDYTPTVGELLASPRTTFACWHDYDQVSTGSGLIWFEEVAGVAYITWDGVHSLITTAPNRFQFQLELATGNVSLVMVSNAGAATTLPIVIGYSVGGASVDPGTTDLSALVGFVSISDLGGANGIQLGSSGSPMIGATTFTIDTSNVPPLVPFGVLLFGTLAIDPGVPLDFLGMETCRAYTNADLLSVAFPLVGGAGSVNLPIPNSAGLLGLQLSCQSLGFTSLTSSGLATSNGLLITVGN